jgi:hypothetical protein
MLIFKKIYFFGLENIHGKNCPLSLVLLIVAGRYAILMRARPGHS